MTGLFIAFEGGEGAGKTTQIAALALKLAAYGRAAAVTREPGTGELGAKIRGVLLGSQPGWLSPKAEALLFAADRAQHVHEFIRPALADGKVVLCDRYIDSSIAYQGVGRQLGPRQVAWLSHWGTGGLLPDLVVLLDINPVLGLARAGLRREGLDRIEHEQLTFHQQVRGGFLDRAAADPGRYLALPADLPAEHITEAVWQRVAPMLAEAPDMDQVRM